MHWPSPHSDQGLKNDQVTKIEFAASLSPTHEAGIKTQVNGVAPKRLAGN